MLALLLLLQATAVSGDPLAPAAGGRLQCYHPDQERRTCRALAGYRRRDDGGYDNKASVLLSPEPAVVMTTVSPVEVGDGAVCGVMRPEQLQAASVTVAGRPLEGAVLTAARGRVTGMMAGVIGRRVCTRYTRVAGTIHAAVTIDGVPRPEADDTLIWVTRAEGYAVAP